MRWFLIVLGSIAALIVVVFGIGMALPVGHSAGVTLYLDAAPEQVFATISEPTSASDWRSDLRQVELLSSAGERLRWREITSSGSLTFVAEESRPPERFVSRIDDPNQPFGGRWIYVLEPRDGGTVVTITEEGEVYNPFFRFMSRFIFGHYATLERYARDLANHFGTESQVRRISLDT